MKKGRVFAVSDLHGCLDLYQQIKDFINPEDIVYCLGDCGDRGPHGWDTIKSVYEDPQFIYLKGNHEDMFIRAMIEYKDIERCGDDYYLYCYNGGGDTFDKWLLEGAFANWIYKLNKLPLILSYTNKSYKKVILTHSGFTPTLGEKFSDEDYIWNRQHFHDIWNENYPDCIIVHGHTPVQNLKRKLILDNIEENKSIKYAENHKIDIDLGSFYSGFTCLLDLDNFEEHIFKSTEVNN